MVQLLQQHLLGLNHLQIALLQTSGNTNAAVITEKPFDFSHDNRYRIGGEFHLIAGIEVIQSLHQTDTANLKQILIRYSLSGKPSDNRIDKRAVLLNKAAFRFFIPQSDPFYQFLIARCLFHDGFFSLS